MRVIVCGTRGLYGGVHWLDLKHELDELKPKTIIHGACMNSADQMADKYARDNRIEVIKFPADWATYKKHAGFLRNRQMAAESHADFCVAVWDGKSNGTRNMIQEATMYGIPSRVIPG